jgi:hypothetical protein
MDLGTFGRYLSTTFMAGENMLLGNMPQHSQNFGAWKRPDAEVFRISSVLYETPANYDYWMARYDAHHKNWGHLRFTLMIPKKIATDVTLAKALVAAAPLDQLKASLLNANQSGPPSTVCFSNDGWTLV